MCVHLAPRWRRRLFVLVLTYLLTADAHILRKLNVWPKTEHTDSKLTSVGKNTDSKVTLVGKNTSLAVGDPIVGVVTTNLTQSLTKVTDEAWNSGSKRDDSHLSTDKSVSFNNLVKSTTTPSTSLKRLKHLELLASKRPKSMDCEGMTPCATRGKINTSDPKQGDDDNGDIDASLDKGPNNAGADISSNIKSTNDETTIQTGITNKAATLEPVLSTTLQSAPMTHAPLSTSLVAGPSDHRTQGYPSSSSRAPSASKEPDSTEVLENETKSAFSTTASRSLDQTLVVVIIGVVGAIGTLVMFVSRRVLKEQDDDLDLEDSRFF